MLPCLYLYPDDTKHRNNTLIRYQEYIATMQGIVKCRFEEIVKAEKQALNQFGHECARKHQGADLSVLRAIYGLARKVHAELHWHIICVLQPPQPLHLHGGAAPSSLQKQNT